MDSSRTADPVWHGRLLSGASASLRAWDGLVGPANADGRVSARSLTLCAGLGELSAGCCEALGGGARASEVRAAGAGLSLLTKLDDQVIDHPGFHGRGMEARALRRRVAGYLWPTLASLESCVPARAEARCVMAAELGRRLVTLTGDRSRLEHLLEVIARGWAVQVEAVTLFTRHPSEVGLEEVERVTASISGLWLLMITLVGTLPAEVGRGLTVGEEAAFQGWGLHIQHADALADFGKDVWEGLVCTSAGWRLWREAPGAFEAALGAPEEAAGLYGALAAHGVDLACMPEGAALESLSAELGALGRVGPLLQWIVGMLLYRYAVHPSSRRPLTDPCWASRGLEAPDVAQFIDGMVARRDELFVPSRTIGEV